MSSKRENFVQRLQRRLEKYHRRVIFVARMGSRAVAGYARSYATIAIIVEMSILAIPQDVAMLPMRLYWVHRGGKWSLLMKFRARRLRKTKPRKKTGCEKKR